MLNQEQLETIKKETRYLLEKLGTPGDVHVEQIKDSEESTVQVSLKVEDPKMLIGERGQTLFDIQHILKLMIRRKITESFYLSLDINEYKKNKEDYLRDLAQTTADEVILLKKPKELPSMPASERRVIHMALADRSDIDSESIGEGTERRVVIRLKP